MNNNYEQIPEYEKSYALGCKFLYAVYRAIKYGDVVYVNPLITNISYS